MLCFSKLWYLYKVQMLHLVDVWCSLGYFDIYTCVLCLYVVHYQQIAWFICYETLVYLYIYLM